jgi:hypothetical protein
MIFADGDLNYWKWQAINTIKVRCQALDAWNKIVSEQFRTVYHIDWTTHENQLECVSEVRKRPSLRVGMAVANPLPTRYITIPVRWECQNIGYDKSSLRRNV